MRLERLDQKPNLESALLSLKTVLLQLTSTRATVRYGTGSVALTLMYETVNIAGISIPRQGVGLATALTSDFDYVSCDGLVVSSHEDLPHQ